MGKQACTWHVRMHVNCHARHSNNVCFLTGEDGSEQGGKQSSSDEQAADRDKAKAKLDALHSRRRQLTAELRAATEEV